MYYPLLTIYKHNEYLYGYYIKIILQSEMRHDINVNKFTLFFHLIDEVQYFQSLEVVDRGSETQFQVTENLILLYLKSMHGQA